MGDKRWRLTGLLLRVAVVVALGTAALIVWMLHRESLVDRSLLTGSPCAAPCWQGIVPGTTTRSQAIEILESSRYVRKGSVQEAGTATRGGCEWRWRVSGRRLQPSLWWQDGVVQEITLGLTYDLVIEDAIGQFGPPEALSAGEGGTPEHWYWIVSLHYPAQGMELRAYTPEYSTALESSTEVGVVVLFAPTTLLERISTTDAGSDAAEESVAPELMRPWMGYGDLFEIYYESRRELSLPAGD